MLQKDPADFLNRRGVALAAMSAAHDELRFDTREMRARIFHHAVVTAGRQRMRRATIAIDLLLPRHRNAQGVLRVDQVIHTLGIFGNRERYALDLAVEGVTRGAGPTISNSLLRTFFRRRE